jgi:hypothetical protein
MYLAGNLKVSDFGLATVFKYKGQGVKPREVELQPLLPFFSYVELVKSRMNDKRAVPRCGRTDRRLECRNRPLCSPLWQCVVISLFSSPNFSPLQTSIGSAA